MKSQQFKLRQFMKLQREKNNSQDSNDKNVIYTSTAAKCLSSSNVKGILKSKSSYSKQTENRDSVKNNILKSDADNEARRKQVVIIDDDKAKSSNKETIANHEKESENDDAMKEFEDFLNSVDDETGDEDAQESNADSSTITTQELPDDSEQAIDDDNNKQRNKEEEELEQTAYEARLAKLILLSRKKGSKVADNTVVDFTPQLAFQESSSASDEIKIQSSDVLPSPSKGRKEDMNSELNAKESLKSILKQKRRKISKAGWIHSHQDHADDDSYWS